MLDPVAQGMRTTAVIETASGGRFVASSEKLLSPAQRASLRAGEQAVRGGSVKAHAEVNGVRAAQAAGQRPIAVGASRPICPECQSFLSGMGIRF